MNATTSAQKPSVASVAKVLSDYVVKASELILSSRLAGLEGSSSREVSSVSSAFGIHIPESFGVREQEVAKREWFEQRVQKSFVLEVILRPTDPNADVEKLSMVLEKWTFGFVPGPGDTDRHANHLVTKTRVTMRALMCFIRTMQAHALCRTIRAAEDQGASPYRREWATRTDSWPPAKLDRYDSHTQQQDFTTLNSSVGTLRVSYSTLQVAQIQSLTAQVASISRGVPAPIADPTEPSSFDDGFFDLEQDQDDDGPAGLSFGSTGSMPPADAIPGQSFGSVAGTSEGQQRSRAHSGASATSAEGATGRASLSYPQGLPAGPITLGPASVGSGSPAGSLQGTPRQQAPTNISNMGPLLSRTASPGQVVTNSFVGYGAADEGDDADDISNIWMRNPAPPRRRSMCSTSSLGSRSPSPSGRKSPPVGNRRKSSSFDSGEGTFGSAVASQEELQPKDILGESAEILMRGLGSEGEDCDGGFSDSSGSEQGARDPEDDLLVTNVVASAVKGSDRGAFVSSNTALRTSWKGFPKEMPVVESPPFRRVSPPMCPSQSTWLHMLVSPPVAPAGEQKIPMFERLPKAGVTGSTVGPEVGTLHSEGLAFLEDSPQGDTEIEMLREEMGELMCQLQAHEDLQVCKQELDMKKTLQELEQLADSW